MFQNLTEGKYFVYTSIPGSETSLASMRIIKVDNFRHYISQTDSSVVITREFLSFIVDWNDQQSGPVK